MKRKVFTIGRKSVIFYHVKGCVFCGRGCALRALSRWIRA